ncbi:MAG: hypothetical protein JRI80_00435 [Deltaproteobacteria bacterium]|nr:hypothetical protein [Deltaproteobacteria bacterium]
MTAIVDNLLTQLEENLAHHYPGLPYTGVDSSLRAAVDIEFSLLASRRSYMGRAYFGQAANGRSIWLLFFAGWDGQPIGIDIIETVCLITTDS